jgi:uncharacterized protein
LLPVVRYILFKEMANTLNTGSRARYTYPMPVLHCPICNKPVETFPKNPSFPFCDERCKLVDLGNWLGDRYRVNSEAPFNEGSERSSEEQKEP